MRSARASSSPNVSARGRSPSVTSSPTSPARSTSDRSNSADSVTPRAPGPTSDDVIFAAARCAVEARPPQRIDVDRVRTTVENLLGHEEARGRAVHQSVPAEPRANQHAVALRDLAEDRLVVRGDFIEAGPLRGEFRVAEQ